MISAHAPFPRFDTVRVINGGEFDETSLSICLGRRHVPGASGAGIVGQASSSNYEANIRPLNAVAGREDKIPRPQSLDQLRSIAEKGDPLAQNNLGYAYAFGRGVTETMRMLPSRRGRWLCACAIQPRRLLRNWARGPKGLSECRALLSRRC